VIVVDDSGMGRQMLSEMLAADPGIDVVGEAADGKQAVALVARLAADIVVMDITMPVMNGLEATAAIMATNPCPVILVSGDAANLDGAFDALSMGALDVLMKPRLDAPPEAPDSVASFVRKVKVMSTVRVIRHRPQRSLAPPVFEPRPAPSGDRVIAIASSTGGPSALAALLSGMPERIAASFAIVQHMAEGFDADLVRWMERESNIPVGLAVHGATLRRGEAVIAPANRHLRIASGGTVELSDEDPVDYQKPSADLLLTSVARVFGAASVGVVLSGMGSDGARGAAAIQAAGGWTVGQDEATSIVFGMARAAVELGAIDVVLPVDSIAVHLAEIVGGEQPSGGAA